MKLLSIAPYLLVNLSLILVNLHFLHFQTAQPQLAGVELCSLPAALLDPLTSGVKIKSKVMKTEPKNQNIKKHFFPVCLTDFVPNSL